MGDRRKLRNILLEPRLQFRYAFRFFLFSALAIGLVLVVAYVLIERVVTRVLTEAGPQTELLAPVIDLAVRTELLRSGWLLLAIGVAALAFTSKMLHRFIGPAVPIKRTLDQLAEGRYGIECRTRAGDEMQDVVASVNALSQALEARHSNEIEQARRRREAGFSLIELLVVLALIMILGLLAVSQFVNAYDRARQRSTLADLRAIVMANGTYHVDNSDYASDLASLSPYHIGTLPAVDRWGYSWTYGYSDGDYSLTSRGSDGADGPAPPAPWDGAPYECDLIVQNGAFVQSPATAN